MSFADWVKGKAPAGTVATVATVASVAVANPQTPKPAFSESENSGVDPGLVATATSATFATPDPAELPADLIEAATRYCVEVHDDSPDAVAAMLTDLQHYPPASWPWLTNYFRALEAPPRLSFDPLSRRLSAHSCGDCRHSIPTDHQAILGCGLGIPSGLPIRGRWSTDRHRCGTYQANVLDYRQPQAGYVDPRTGTETRTDIGWGYDRLEGWTPPTGRYDPGLRPLLQNIQQNSTLQPMRRNAYDVATEPGGRHHNWYREQKNNGYRQLRKAIASFQKRIAEHRAWIAHPESKVQDWMSRDIRYREGLLNHWRNDIERHHEFIEILQGVLIEMGYTDEQFLQNNPDSSG